MKLKTQPRGMIREKVAVTPSKKTKQKEAHGGGRPKKGGGLGKARSLISLKSTGKEWGEGEEKK